ncbi:MAG: FkbM family methyltransferase [Bacteroidota bacterium]|nr:FkbM family methyltransferase [Bacteroidota bacterium]
MGFLHRTFLALTKPAASGPMQKVNERIAVKIGHRFPQGKVGISFCRALGDNILRHEGGNTCRTATLLTSAKVVFEFTQATKMLYFLGTDDHTDEIPVANLLMRTVRKGDVFFDLGANVGFYAFLVAPLCGKRGSVHAFEPNPNLVPNLLRSAELNSSTCDVVVNGVAVGREDGGEISLYFSSDAQDIGVTSTYPHPWLDSNSKITVPVTSIDAYRECHKLERIDYVKIDIEGAELDALQGMTETFRRHPPLLIICELWRTVQKINNAEFLPDPAVPSTVKVFDFLSERGYEPMYISKGGFFERGIRRNDLLELQTNKINAAFIAPQLKTCRPDLFVLQNIYERSLKGCSKQFAKAWYIPEVK